MLVGERMSHPVITIPPDLPVVDAISLMKREKIRRTPVVRDGKLVGIVSDKDLLNATPSTATSLSVWEMNYLLSKINVELVMAKDVITTTEDTPIEEAARIMSDHRIGGLPVLRDDRLVGIITIADALVHEAKCRALGEPLPFIRDVMTDYVYTVDPDAGLAEAARIMVGQHISALPVVEERRVVGIVTESDIFRRFVELQDKT